MVTITRGLGDGQRSPRRIDASAPMIESVCRLPIDYHAIGTKTLIQLMEEAGYFENPSAVTESAIQSCLAKHPDFCAAWIGYSQARRTDSGWVIDVRNGMFIVFYHPNGSTKLKYNDRSAACAAFAIRELTSLAKHRR
jgi:hypothetical protein